jgi:hypothetical protein
MKMMKDPEVIAEADKRKIDLGALDGEGLQKIVDETLSVTPDVKARALEARAASE